MARSEALGGRASQPAAAWVSPHEKHAAGLPQGADKEAMRQLESAEFISGPVSADHQQLEAALDATRWASGWLRRLRPSAFFCPPRLARAGQLAGGSAGCHAVVVWGASRTFGWVVQLPVRSHRQRMRGPRPCPAPHLLSMSRLRESRPVLIRGLNEAMVPHKEVSRGGQQQAAGGRACTVRGMLSSSPVHANRGAAACCTRVRPLTTTPALLLQLRCAVQGVRSEQSPEPLRSELARLLWQELGAKCFYASTVGGELHPRHLRRMCLLLGVLRCGACGQPAWPRLGRGPCLRGPV